MPETPADHTDNHVDSLGDRFLVVSRRLRRRYALALEPLGITPHQARTLRVVARCGPLRLGELAAQLHIAPRSVTDVVDALEDLGYVRRAPDPRDRRATAVEATTQGRRESEAVEELRRNQADQFFARLPEPDRAELARLLDDLTDN
ncbi:DNA-binding MarR family transcriptional regulator [Kineosphaera limosa]|uniref:Putative MarR family transcriptional regulator n=1 Tax=Kineosphaera limosa NBRC 100340 TaxID=1184609 RepID=K6VL17_9MICO|nr:MarR family winged helix-turn-helix transcriptional regulator [Kineosphaera limosa]NYD99063.1 DNA-binding MarR family transcriptional regulator [Kineosphaera limosa]GAB96903.1 putative MarR family transcriptional regulator [Kineosphaera limosa NBRC 100340]